MRYAICNGDIPPHLPDLPTVTFPREYYEHWRQKSLERGRKAMRREENIRMLRAALLAVTYGRWYAVDKPACAFCRRLKTAGHDPSCLVGRALKRTDEYRDKLRLTEDQVIIQAFIPVPPVRDWMIEPEPCSVIVRMPLPRG